MAPWPNDDHLRVVFRRSCYGCRRGLGRWVRWHESMHGHRWTWQYRIRWNGVVVSMRTDFGTFELAYASMVRTVKRLEAADVIRLTLHAERVD